MAESKKCQCGKELKRGKKKFFKRWYCFSCVKRIKDHLTMSISLLRKQSDQFNTICTYQREVRTLNKLGKERRNDVTYSK